MFVRPVQPENTSFSIFVTLFGMTSSPAYPEADSVERFGKGYETYVFALGEPVLCGGVRLHAVDPGRLRSVEVGVWLIRTAMALYPDEFRMRGPDEQGRWHIDLSSGSGDLRDGSLSAPEIIANWRAEAESFRPRWRRHLIDPQEDQS